MFIPGGNRRSSSGSSNCYILSNACGTCSASSSSNSSSR